MSQRNRYYSGQPNDHFDGLRFFNPGHPSTDRSLRDIWRWRREGKAARWPASVPGKQVVPEPRVAGLRVTAVGHATVLIQSGSLNVLTDPVWSQRASPLSFLGPKRVTPPGIAFEQLPPIDAVLLSHNHYDHLDIATLRRLHEAHRPLIVTPLGNDAILRRAIPDARIATGDWWESCPIGADASATIVPAHHWSARGLGDRRMALWGGFMLRTPAGLVYFAGDTAYGDGAIFRAMRERVGAPDVALVPIGAYAPRWFMRNQHVDPDEAVRILRDLGARNAMAIHWGVFQLTDEAREEPAAQLEAALQRHPAKETPACRVMVAEPGDVLEMPSVAGSSS